ncbi:DUF2085 domain-containing protein [Halorubrum sp. BOL3-1]|uniref:DUF2085 domain-containing protein n=1 Tax=Halorubrum sp. BOL3-1 TaxID=2497325 RepID=UPI001004F6EF|nr:DUF2085 domain-containing protein [Halorubrum sp. BOL3-1]
MTLLDFVFRLSNRVFRPYPFCHSRPDRSLCYHRRYFGLCARCTGMYLAGCLMILSFPFRGELLSPTLNIILGTVLLLPGGIDGTTQMFGSRESNNFLRVVTGLFLGVGVVLFAEGVLFILIG